MILFFIVVLLIPCLAIKKRTDADGEILDSRSTTSIKGVLCLYVMLHNLGLDYKGNSQVALIICEHTGGIAVGIFFFLSAYGIIRSYQKYGNKYLKKLIFSNCLKLYIVSVLINVLTYFVYLKDNFTTPNAILSIFNLEVFNGFLRINRHGWYISTIIVLYLIFALIYFACSKLKTNNKFLIAGTLLSVSIILFRIIVPNIASGGGTYTREIDAFIIGIIYATYYNKINAFFKKYFLPSFLICFVIFWVGLFFAEKTATHSAVLIIIILSQKISYSNNITHFLGKISLGVYLFLHFSTLTLQYFVTNQYLWTILNAGFILELSIVLYGVQNFLTSNVKNLLQKLKKPRYKVIR